jgi:hypothetical protein
MTAMKGLTVLTRPECRQESHAPARNLYVQALASHPLLCHCSGMPV